MKKLIMMTAALFIFSSNASAVQAPFNIPRSCTANSVNQISDLDFVTRFIREPAYIVIAPRNLVLVPSLVQQVGKNRAIIKVRCEAS